jgi:hypothetical protein
VIPEAFRQIDISNTLRLLRPVPYVITVYGLKVPPIAVGRQGDTFYCYEADQGILVYIPSKLVDP